MTEQERLNRIQEIYEELKQLRAAVPRSDWHKAFEALLRFTTYKYKGIRILPEMEIGIDPPRADYVILVDDGEHDFEEAIFRIFRKIDVLEYKNPHDDLNWRTLHKIIAYAEYMIGTAEHEGDVPPDEVTISIFRATKSKALFKEMEQKEMLKETDTSGIYEVIGLTPLPFQIVITSELEGAEYAAFRALTDNADEADVKQALNGFQNVSDESLREYGEIVLDLIAKKNPALFADVIRGDNMKYPGLMAALRDEVDKEVEKKVNEKINEKVNENEQEMTVNHLKNLMETLTLTLEQAMDAIKIPQNQRARYAGLVDAR